jgi:hypothetical protein
MLYEQSETAIAPSAASPSRLRVHAKTLSYVVAVCALICASWRARGVLDVIAIVSVCVAWPALAIYLHLRDRQRAEGEHTGFWSAISLALRASVSAALLIAGPICVFVLGAITLLIPVCLGTPDHGPAPMRDPWNIGLSVCVGLALAKFIVLDWNRELVRPADDRAARL